VCIGPRQLKKRSGKTQSGKGEARVGRGRQKPPGWPSSLLHAKADTLKIESLKVMDRFPFSVVVFDLDGTLINTAPDLTDALNHMLGRLGREPVPAAKVIEIVGRGMRNLVERSLDATGSARPAPEEKALSIFLEYYEAHIADGTRPYEGAEAALDRLRRRGARLAICTNKPENLTRKLLAAFGWTERFASVIGGDTLPARKPDAAPLREAIDRAGGGRAVLVGDSITDVQTANAAGLPCMAVTWGFRDRPAEALGATGLIDRFDELVAALEKLSFAKADN
jgi:phosphoglycolate phosphatase